MDHTTGVKGTERIDPGGHHCSQTKNAVAS